MNKILTIAVPSYNVEKVLPKCLDSFICEHMDKLEVLVVNDGSKDNTSQVASEYAIKYPNVFRVINKENGGHGSAINAGLNEAKGKYFKLIDGDDWVDTAVLDKMLIELENIDTDLVISNYREVYEDSGKTVDRNLTKEIGSDGEIINLEDIIDKIFLQMHTVIVKPEIYRQHNLKMYEKCFYVDIQYICFPMQYFKNLKIVDCILYQYRLGQEGQSVSDNGYIKHTNDHERVILSVLELAKNYPDKTSNKYKYIVKVVKALLNIHIDIYCRKCLNDKNKTLQIRNLSKEIMANYSDIVMSNDNIYRITKILLKNGVRNVKFWLFIKKVSNLFSKIKSKVTL